ncbi:rhodopsin-like isoform X1 [Alosa sapidissima]|uniref:rhodopsin-like isoform X1 n=1 Tax=Alosa sapidissima TaxID=34773 RepID=UPI001C091A84|nr:rhodopsin-like isoform X1 [Alosa sapidissima]
MSVGVNGTLRGAVSVPSSITPFFRSQLSPSADLAVAIFLITTGVVSVVGNGVVLLVYGRKRKKLRPHELLTINLAVCDFGYSLLGAPFPITSRCPAGILFMADWPNQSEQGRATAGGHIIRRKADLRGSALWNGTAISLSHAWVFGQTGCLYYGMQGFVFGIGSLITTCLISLDRAFKICSIQYGQWVERRHASLSIVLVWIYTIFWGLLPVFGFGSYGPEPYATSCTINWWSMKSSLNDKIYIYLIMSLCFGVPTLIIITSYIAIMVTVYRSSRTLASIPSSTVTHSSKELRLTKIAAVVCSSFLLAWMPYAIVSLYSALTAKEEPGEYVGILTAEAGPTGQATPKLADFLAFPSLLNWTSVENYTTIHETLDMWSNSTMHSNFRPDFNPVSSVGPGSVLGPQSTRAVSSLPPEVTLIPAMFAKSHCMVNPFIYQIMNHEFRANVCYIFCGRGLDREMTSRRGREGSDSEGNRSSMNLSYCHSWRKSSSNTPNQGDHRKKKLQNPGSEKGHRSSWHGSGGSDWASLDAATLDTQINIEGEKGSEKGQGGSTSSSLLTCED